MNTALIALTVFAWVVTADAQTAPNGRTAETRQRTPTPTSTQSVPPTADSSQRDVNRSPYATAADFAEYAAKLREKEKSSRFSRRCSRQPVRCPRHSVALGKPTSSPPCFGLGKKAITGACGIPIGLGTTAAFRSRPVGAARLHSSRFHTVPKSVLLRAAAKRCHAWLSSNRKRRLPSLGSNRLTRIRVDQFAGIAGLPFAKVIALVTRSGRTRPVSHRSLSICIRKRTTKTKRQSRHGPRCFSRRARLFEGHQPT